MHPGESSQRRRIIKPSPIRSLPHETLFTGHREKAWLWKLEKRKQPPPTPTPASTSTRGTRRPPAGGETTTDVIISTIIAVSRQGWVAQSRCPFQISQLSLDFLRYLSIWRPVGAAGYAPGSWKYGIWKPRRKRQTFAVGFPRRRRASGAELAMRHKSKRSPLAD